ncbi:MAG: protein translocase subunit SecD, partial [Phycisphaerae bacterium]|nr:protein translocase subunit SecD [Phycisphaerae bacterium]
ELYKERLKDLIELDVKPSEINATERLSPERRRGALLALERGVGKRRAALAALADAWDKLDKARANAPRVESPSTTQPEKMDPAVAKAMDQYLAARREVLATNIRMPEVEKVRRMTPKERTPENKRGEAVASPLTDLLERYPERRERIKALLAASDEWGKQKQALDDPNDLKRQLRGTGKLEFFIAVSPGEAAGVESLQRELEKRTDCPDERFRWVEVDAQTAAKTGNVIQGRRLGINYILVWQTSEKSLQHTSDQEWKFRSAHQSLDEWANPSVAFTFDSPGGVQFHKMTLANLKRLLCAVLENKAVSIATIQSAISTNGQISGSFSREEAQDLAQKMQAGALPGSLSDDPISEARVDPQLGRAEMSAGLKAALIGLIAVVVFMLIYYMVPLGLVADIAVVFNIIYLLGSMAMLKATFTMPGIAGLILTIGMAVDANVLIDERIREEQAKGLTLRQALKNGYSRAFSVIIDSHVTAIMTSVILYFVGTTEIKGFATTLIIGLIFSLFTSVFVTRWILQLAVEYGWIKNHVNMMKIIGVPKIGWMNKRFVFWGMSLAAILLGLFVFIREPAEEKYDVEFIGGTKAQVTLADGAKATEPTLRDLLRDRNPGSLFKGVSVRRIEIGAGGGVGQTFEIITPAAEKEQTAAFRAAIVKTLSEPKGFGGLGTASLLPAKRAEVTFAQKGDWVTVASAWRKYVALPKADQTPEQAKKLLPDKLPAGAFVITDAYMPQTGDANLESFRGGVGIIVSGLPPTALTELRSRISAQLNSPEYSDLPTSQVTGEAEGLTSGWELLGLDEVGQTGQFTRVLYVARSQLGDESAGENWLAKLALPEVAAVCDALTMPQELNSVTYFSPSVASDLAGQALLAIILSMVAIMIYIWVRFGNWLFGLGAIVPIFHDAAVVIGMVAISKYIAPTWLGQALMIGDFRFDLTIVAAVLTVIGYSTNDTIVVFDRIRENRGRLSYVTSQSIDASVNQTLSRTILTSLTVFLVLIIMYVLGGQGIRAFNFAMIIGVVTGTYSSIAIAAPVLLGWTRMIHKKILATAGPQSPAAPEAAPPAKE